ncbi:hypothetical protein ACJRO7_002029 [Eucalyptus globulus]|uniref:Uncharacterized protein n=1 Tax=Eucalyptus globulus TaxID=34317 RepID=A0ABD3LSW9_EUCGL
MSLAAGRRSPSRPPPLDTSHRRRSREPSSLDARCCRALPLPVAASTPVTDYPTQVDLSRARLHSRPTTSARSRSPDDADSAISARNPLPLLEPEAPTKPILLSPLATTAAAHARSPDDADSAVSVGDPPPLLAPEALTTLILLSPLATHRLWSLGL